MKLKYFRSKCKTVGKVYCVETGSDYESFGPSAKNIFRQRQHMRTELHEFTTMYY